MLSSNEDHLSEEAQRLEKIRKKKAENGKKIIIGFIVVYAFFFFYILQQKMILSSGFARMYMQPGLIPDIIRGLLTLALLLFVLRGKSWARVVTIIYALITIVLTIANSSSLTPNMVSFFVFIYGCLIVLLVTNSNIKILCKHL